MAAVTITALTTLSAHAQTYTVLYTFTGAPNAAQPSAGLVADGNALYGVTMLGGTGSCTTFGTGCGTVFDIQGVGKENLVYSFNSTNPYPESPLTRDASGNLYGAASGFSSSNYGEVFKLTPAGDFTSVYTFTGPSTGEDPSRVLPDSSGNLYGTTATGGDSTNSGLIFKISPSGKETVLYTFHCPQCFGGSGGGFGIPSGGVVADAAGNLYGVASGGDGCSQRQGCGVVYKVNRAGVATVLYNFTGKDDGWDPSGNLIMDNAGNLYGTTTSPDGSACDATNCGAVFKVNSATGATSVLFDFDGGPDGGSPNGGLVRDSQGNIYGTTWIGGGNYSTCNPMPAMPVGCGVVYKLAPNGTQTILHTFANTSDGGYPNGNLFLDSAGNVYGTTAYGGDPTCGCGVVFKITP